MKWHPVYGYEGLYEATDKGVVRSLKRATTLGKILSISFTNGYAYVSLCKDGIAKRSRLSRVILNSFIGPKPDLQCNHKSGIKTDDSIENLEWTTRVENIQHRIKVLGMDHSTFNRKYTDEQILEMRELFDGGMRVCDIARKFTRAHGVVWQIVHRRTRKHAIYPTGIPAAVSEIQS